MSIITFHSGLDFIKIGKNIQNFFSRTPIFISNSGKQLNTTRNPNLENKNEKHRFYSLNRPFIDVAHFENTITNDSEKLPGLKKNPKYLKLIYFILKWLNLNKHIQKTGP